MSVGLQEQPVTATEQLPVDVKPTPPTVRKKRAPKHDFKDGNGRVFAHRHDNGNGWVADTAKVNESVYVGPRSEIFNFARVSGGCRLEGLSRIYGHAEVSGSVILKKTAQIYGRSRVVDLAQLHDNSSISGHATVSGNTQLFDTAAICDRTTVAGSRISGSARIWGDAILLRSNLTGPIQIGGNGCVICSTLYGAIVVDNYAQIAHSTVNLYSTTRAATFKNFSVVADNCHIYMPIEVKDHAVLARVTINNGARMPDNVDITSIGNNITIGGRTINSAAELTQLLTAAANPRNNTPAISAVTWQQPGRGPTDITPKNRRIIRL